MKLLTGNLSFLQQYQKNIVNEAHDKSKPIRKFLFPRSNISRTSNKKNALLK